MARIRTIKPDMFASLGRQGVSIGARWFMAGMVTYADDHGRFEWMPRKVLGCLFPEDPGVSEQDVSAWLDELLSIGVIEMYEVAGRTYGHFPKWLQHQRVKNPSKSYLPEPSSSRHDSTITEDRSKSYGESTEDVPQSGALEIGNRKIFTLPNGSDASSDADADSVIELEIVSSEPREALEPQVIEPEVLDTNPYPTVERILTALSQATDQPPPTAAMIRRYIGKSSSILRLVEFCGEADATVLLAWCALFKPELGYGAVFSNAQSLLAEARSVDWKAPASKGKPKWGDPADDVDRMLSEHDKLLAARAEEDRYIRENW